MLPLPCRYQTIPLSESCSLLSLTQVAVGPGRTFQTRSTEAHVQRRGTCPSSQDHTACPRNQIPATPLDMQPPTFVGLTCGSSTMPPLQHRPLPKALGWAGKLLPATKKMACATKTAASSPRSPLIWPEPSHALSPTLTVKGCGTMMARSSATLAPRGRCDVRPRLAPLSKKTVAPQAI